MASTSTQSPLHVDTSTIKALKAHDRVFIGRADVLDPLNQQLEWAEITYCGNDRILAMPLNRSYFDAEFEIDRFGGHLLGENDHYRICAHDYTADKPGQTFLTAHNALVDAIGEFREPKRLVPGNRVFISTGNDDYVWAEVLVANDTGYQVAEVFPDGHGQIFEFTLAGAGTNTPHSIEALDTTVRCRKDPAKAIAAFKAETQMGIAPVRLCQYSDYSMQPGSVRFNTHAQAIAGVEVNQSVIFDGRVATVSSINANGYSLTGTGCSCNVSRTGEATDGSGRSVSAFIQYNGRAMNREAIEALFVQHGTVSEPFYDTSLNALTDLVPGDELVLQSRTDNSLVVATVYQLHEIHGDRLKAKDGKSSYPLDPATGTAGLDHIVLARVNHTPIRSEMVDQFTSVITHSPADRLELEERIALLDLLHASKFLPQYVGHWAEEFDKLPDPSTQFVITPNLRDGTITYNAVWSQEPVEYDIYSFEAARIVTDAIHFSQYRPDQDRTTAALTNLSDHIELHLRAQLLAQKSQQTQYHSPGM